MTRTRTRFHAQPPHPRHATLAALALGLLGGLWANPLGAQGIYTCTDAKGRKLTSDRPIVECLDREQKELSTSGVVKRVVPPSYTAEERAQAEAQRKAEAEQQARVSDEKRQQRALLTRYPNQTTHDKARATALEQVDAVIALIHKRDDELLKQKHGIDAELEFYKKDPSKAPAWLKKRSDENAQQRAAQARRLAEQQVEKDRINARFDEELQRLRGLWAQPVKR